MALALCGVGALLSPSQFFHSYLMGFLLWLGIALGCLAFVMIHHLSGGEWGTAFRPLLEAATRTMPLLALLWVPILFGLRPLYLWARPEAVATDAVLQYKHLYLNVPFFLARAVLYFALWSLFAFFLNRWSLEQRRADDEPGARRLRRLSAGGLVVYVLTITFASIDWVMSLEPHWFSSIFGLLFIGGQGIGALAFVIASAVLLFERMPFARSITAQNFHDLGNLLLAFVMLWAYFAFSQFLIIWSGNLPEEIPWYVHRLQSGWQWIGVALVVFHFAVPFMLLLSRTTKRTGRTLAYVAAGVIVMRLVDLFWLIAPELHQDGLRVHWLDLLAPIGIGGIWLAAFTWQLKARSADEARLALELGAR